MDLIQRVEAGQGGFLLFALTPPRHDTDRERTQEIADTTVARLRLLGLDGLILYDIDDETDRNPAERPFPFMPTLDPPTSSPTTSGPGRRRSSSTARSPSTTPSICVRGSPRRIRRG